MGVMLNKKIDTNDELSRRIDADLRRRAMQNSDDSDKDSKTPDFAEDSEYVKNFKKTSKFSWIWLVLILAAVIIVVLNLVIPY